MTDQQNTPGPEPTPQPEPNQQSTREAWREVGRQFQTLGDSLATAIRAAWQDEGSRQRIEEMRAGVESMVDQVGHVLHEYSNSPQGQQIRSEAKRTADNIRTAGEQTFNDARPHLVSALRQVNNELQRMIDQMDKPHQPGGGPDQPQGQP